MNLYAYVSRLEDTLRARNDIALERLRLTVTSIGVIFEARAWFSDGSFLSMVEEVERVGHQRVRTIVYKFHYQ